MKYDKKMALKRATFKQRQTRALISERFKTLYAQTGLDLEGVGKLLHVTPRTVRNWLSGDTHIPYSAYKLLRVLRLFELPVPGFEGWCMHSGKLWTPEGHPIEPVDGGWWSLLVRQARSFRVLYEQETQRRMAAPSRAGDAPAAPAPASAAGLVSVSTTVPGVFQPEIQNDVIMTSWPIPYDYLQASTPPPGPEPITLASVSTPSFALPWMPSCGFKLATLAKTLPEHLRGSKAHQTRLNGPVHVLANQSYREPPQPTSSPRPSAVNSPSRPAKTAKTSGRPVAGAKPTKTASASGSQS